MHMHGSEKNTEMDKRNSTSVNYRKCNNEEHFHMKSIVYLQQFVYAFSLY